MSISEATLYDRTREAYWWGFVSGVVAAAVLFSVVAIIIDAITHT